MKRVRVALLVCLMILLGTVAACQKEDTAGEEQGNITLDWYIHFSWYNTTWGDDLVAQKITEDTGVEINYISPSGNESEKLSALMNSDTLPDIITLGWWEPQISEMIESGMVYAWNELSDEYNTVLTEVVDQDVFDWYTLEDGNIYCYPNSYYTPKDLKTYDNISSNITFLVRKDIYEALGSPDMTSPEGFMAAVRGAQELFPDVDSKPLIPIGSHVFDNMGCVSFDKYLQNFLAVPYEKDGQIYDRYTDPEYINWLKVFRQLGEEGHLRPDIFVDTRTQMDEKISQGRYFCMLYQYTDVLDQQKILAGVDSNMVYMAVPGPQNSRGADPKLPVTGMNGWTVTLISKKCKDPQKAIEFMEYLLSEEGQMVTYLGVEGETYDMVDGKAVVREDVQNLLNANREKYDEVYGADFKYWMLQNLKIESRYPQEYPEYISQLRKWASPYVIYNGQYDSQLASGTSEAAIENRINQLWSQALPDLLMAETEELFDQKLEAFIAAREALGFDTVQKAKTEFMIQAKEKLGTK